MKQLVRKHSEDKTKREFPIAGLLDGWFFRQAERSTGVYEVAGTDLWGRSVSETGTDPEALLAKCVEGAREIERQSREVR
jgi:hypothetical protein